MEEGAERATKIIENFRYFSYSGSKAGLKSDLHKIIDHSLLILKPKFKDQIKVQKNFSPIPKVPCQPVELGQVFVNMFSNACDAILTKASPPGILQITTGSTKKGVQVNIYDNGEGIQPHKLSRIFDSFYTTKSQGQGTGLGLAISLEIIKKYKGDIQVKSQPNWGSEFIIRIPV